MKKLVTMVVGAMAAVAAFAAAQNDLRVTFWSAGPDQYKDGSTVVDGEMYALVWTKAGSTFAGFAADGSLVDAAASQLVVAGPWAQGGKCKPMIHLIDAEKAPAYSAGTFALVCLDTRNADGTVSAPERDANGLAQLTVVNGATMVAASTSDGLSSSMSSKGGVFIDTASPLPEGVPQPEITGLEMVNVNGEQMMKLTVKNTVPYLRYKGAKVELSADAESAGQDTGIAANGAATADKEVEVLVPAKGKQGFFKVTRQ